jgi:hypothetical protein
MAPLGLLLLLYKTGRSLLFPSKPMRSWVRVLDLAAVLGLGAAAYGVFVGFQAMLGVSFNTGFAFFPDLTVTTVVTIVLVLLLAAGRLALVVRGE